MKPQRKQDVEVKRHDYQPSKKELGEIIKLDIPGDTPEERMENLAKAMVVPINLVETD